MCRLGPAGQQQAWDRYIAASFSTTGSPSRGPDPVMHRSHDLTKPPPVPLTVLIILTIPLPPPPTAGWFQVTSSDGEVFYHNKALNMSQYNLTAEQQAQLLPPLDPYNTPLYMPLTEFIEHPIAQDLLHDGIFFQVGAGWAGGWPGRHQGQCHTP